MILLAIIHLGEEVYGVPISRELEKNRGRDASVGSVYAALERLESKGLVSSSLGDPTPERGGKAKRFFSSHASWTSPDAGHSPGIGQAMEEIPGAERGAYMKRTKPPSLATWILENMTLGERNEALAGDLLEDFRCGRPARWYWRQVLVAVALSCHREFVKRRTVFVFAACWSMLSPAWLLAIADTHVCAAPLAMSRPR
jgi:hypothetical protein